MIAIELPEGHVNWCATTPRPPGPLSKHQKYFLQSRGCGKNPSSSHLKSIENKKLIFLRCGVCEISRLSYLSRDRVSLAVPE